MHSCTSPDGVIFVDHCLPTQIAMFFSGLRFDKTRTVRWKLSQDGFTLPLRLRLSMLLKKGNAMLGACRLKLIDDPHVLVVPDLAFKSCLGAALERPGAIHIRRSLSTGVCLWRGCQVHIRRPFLSLVSGRRALFSIFILQLQLCLPSVSSP